jgi:4-hydroxyphenylpyruvate dioxygenase-like putative hemolysin
VPACLPACSKSQIQTFLEQNEGPGLQHMALKTDDIVATMTQMRARWVHMPGTAGAVLACGL